MSDYRKTVRDLIEENLDEIEALAAECFIDFRAVFSSYTTYFHKQIEQETFKKDNLPQTDPKKRSAMYVVFCKYPDGNEYVKINFSTMKGGGHSTRWSSYGLSTYTGKQVNLRERQEKEKRLREQDLKRRREAEKKLQKEREKRIKHYNACKKAYESSRYPANTLYPYLAEKSISQIAKIDDNLKEVVLFGRKQIAFKILKPSNNVGEGDIYAGIQTIAFSHKDKKWVKKLSSKPIDGRWYQGHYALIGPEPENNQETIIFITEGYATGASVHLATYESVFIAISANNIMSVAKMVRARFPQSQIVIAADNDIKEFKPHEEQGNTGVSCAIEAAREVRGSYTVPPTPGDWNDFHTSHGYKKFTEEIWRRITSFKISNDDHLLEMIRHSYKDKVFGVGGYLRSLARLKNVPFITEKENFIDAIINVCDRFKREDIERDLQHYINISLAKAKKLCTVNPKKVDAHFRFETENINGAWMISDKAQNKIIESLEQGSIVVVSAPMGVGKTQRTIKQVMDLSWNALIALPTISTVSSTANFFNADKAPADTTLKSIYGEQQEDNRVTVYTDIKDSRETLHKDKIITCVQSIGGWRFGIENNYWSKNVETLILDEFSQSIAQITQLGKSKRKVLNYEVLKEAMETAKCVLATDADANDYAIDRIRELAPSRRIVLIEVSHPNEAMKDKQWDIQYTDNKHFLFKDMIDTIKKGKRILVATDSRKNALIIKEMILENFPKLHGKVKCIVGEAPEEDQEDVLKFLEDPNLAYECEVLIYSPKISSGFSIHKKKHFDKHYGIFSGIIASNVAVQMMGRDRHSKNWLLCLTGSRSSNSFDMVGALEKLGERVSDFTKLVYTNESYEKETRENVLATILNILLIKGHKIQKANDYIGDNEKKSISILTKQIKDQLKERRYSLILNTPEIDEKTYRQVKESEHKSEIDEAYVTAYRIRNRLCSELTRENIDFIDNDGISKVILFENVFGNIEQVKNFDREEKELDPSLKYFAIRKRNLMERILETLGLMNDGKCDFTKRFTHREANEVIKLIYNDIDISRKLLGSCISKSKPKCSITFIKRIFKKIGLDLGKKKINGRIVRFVQQESIEIMAGYWDRRTKAGKAKANPPFEYSEVA